MEIEIPASLAEDPEIRELLERAEHIRELMQDLVSHNEEAMRQKEVIGQKDELRKAAQIEHEAAWAHGWQIDLRGAQLRQKIQDEQLQLINMWIRMLEAMHLRTLQ